MVQYASTSRRASRRTWASSVASSSCSSSRSSASAKQRARFVDTLGSSKLFGGLPEELLALFANGASLRTHEPGAHLWRINDAALDFIIVQTGLVEVRRPIANGDGATLGLFGPGDSVGDFAVVAVGAYPADAIAADTTSVVRVRGGPVLEALQREPRVAQAVTASLVEHSRILRMKIDIMSAGSTTKRLARLFVHITHRFGVEAEDGRVHVPVKLSRGQLARLVGARVETVIRTMSRWRGCGWIEPCADGYLTSLAPLASLVAG